MIRFDRTAMRHALPAFWCGAMLVYSPNVIAQEVPQGDGLSLVHEVAAHFANGAAVHHVQLTGTAKWYAGSLEDSGSATLSANQDGSSQMELSIGTLGRRIEARTGSGFGAQCTWSSDDESLHAVDLESCWNPFIWFLPAFSLQPSQWSEYERFTDLGQGEVGASSQAYRHLHGQYQRRKQTDEALSDAIERSGVDLGIDSQTSNPSVLAYQLSSQNTALQPLKIEIHFSDYRQVSGVQVPFHIERLVNGSLQLDIVLSSADCN